MMTISNFGSVSSPCYTVSFDHMSAEVDFRGISWTVTLFNGEERVSGAIFFTAREAYTWASWAVAVGFPNGKPLFFILTKLNRIFF